MKLWKFWLLWFWIYVCILFGYVSFFVLLNLCIILSLCSLSILFILFRERWCEVKFIMLEWI